MQELLRLILNLLDISKNEEGRLVARQTKLDVEALTALEAFVQGSTEALGARTSRGLGLAFCRLAAEAHGGSIWVEDGHPGAVFCVRLPNGP